MTAEQQQPHAFEDAPGTAHLAYTTNRGYEVVCSVCDGEVAGHRDFVSDYAARSTYSAYEQR